MRKAPTDLKILKSIYNKYYQQYAAYNDDNKTRSSKIHVPIDIEKLAEQMNIDCDIIFGRLYYHLNQKYSYEDPRGARVDMFSMRVGKDRHCIHFPYMASVLASLQSDNQKYLIATGFSIVALVLSIFSFFLKYI